MMNRRQFAQVSSLALGGLVKAEESLTSKKLLSLGLVTDIHYADKPQRGSRAYRDSLAKAKEFSALFIDKKPDAIVSLGDLVDAAPTVKEELSYLQKIVPVMNEPGIPCHYVLGNHCIDTLTKEEFFKHAKTASKTGHYSFDINGVHLIILDACYTKNMEHYGRNNSKWNDANIPPEQLAWLKKDLQENNLPTLIFAHQRLDLSPKENYAIKQCLEVREILEKSQKVLAVFQGHSHKNELHEINGIPYCTLSAVIEGKGVENNSYSILDVYDNKTAKLKGYRKQADRKFKA
ncbi:metallophosphoesterase [Akkermansiaceae bacterium]|nr:metallophosphoesterase [Akkermansiaceae bacterium]